MNAMNAVNATHDPSRRSWIESANLPAAEFPLQNLPLGIFLHKGHSRGGVAIGNQVIDLAALLNVGLLGGEAAVAAAASVGATLNPLMALGNQAASALRWRLADLLDRNGCNATDRGRLQQCLVPQADVTMQLPCDIGDFTDFLTSAAHTERHGRLKGLQPPLPPAFKHLPVAYHGRSSSIRVSGTPVCRPNGQWLDDAKVPRFGAVESLDFELEMGAFVGRGNALGKPIPLCIANEHIFGYCLLNDWSAKGVQWWEQVLGPFLGKSFMTSISPWIVTSEALVPFAKQNSAHQASDPSPLGYLTDSEGTSPSSFSIQLSATIRTARMRANGDSGTRISSTSLDAMYWSFRQMLVHHASNGCNLRPGDVLGSGTLSGDQVTSMGCLTEMTSAGRHPISLGSGEQRPLAARRRRNRLECDSSAGGLRLCEFRQLQG
jgi:fumarylacetoacetase